MCLYAHLVKAQDEHLTPDAERCHELIELLSQAWTADREFVKVTSSADAIFAPVVFAHVAHAIQLTRAVSTLHRAGDGLVMMPLVRQVIECAIRAVWLELYRGNVHAVVREGFRERKNLLDSAVEAAWLAASDSVVEDAHRALEGESDGATSGRSFQRICAELEGGERHYALYRLASALTHPGTDLVEHYIERSEIATSGIGFVADPGLESMDAWLGITAQHALVAVYAWDRVETGRPYRTSLRPWAEGFGVGRKRPGMTAIGFTASNKAETRRRRAKKVAMRSS